MTDKQDKGLLTPEEIAKELLRYETENAGREISNLEFVTHIAKAQLAKAKKYYEANPNDWFATRGLLKPQAKIDKHRLDRPDREKIREMTLREEKEKIYDMSTGQETKASDQGNIWVRFSLSDWQALKQGKLGG